MAATLELGSLVNNRYQIQQIVKQSQYDCIYLVLDKINNNEKSILKEFIARNPSLTVYVKEFFQTMLETLTKLKHPYIQQIQDFFWDCDRLFIVEQYIEGQTYRDWLRCNSPLTEQQAIQLLNQILPALTYLHSQNIIHADISPDNILLKSSSNFPILSNFAIVRDISFHMGIETIEEKLLDRIKQLPVDTISPGIDEDLYCLAVTIVMLLTGRDLPELFNEQTHTWEWENWKLVSDRLADVLNKMLSLQTRDRFPNADAILQAINPSISPSHPVATTEISSPPTYIPETSNVSQKTLIVSPPTYIPETNNISQKTSIVSRLTDWQKAAITGGIIGISLIIGITIFSIFWFNREKQTATESQQETSVEQEDSSTSPFDLPTQRTSEQSQSISQEKAVELIGEWQQAKQKLFAQPFDYSLLAEITTGECYEKNIGSMNWLRENNAYYRYGVQRIDSTENFFTNSDRATIEVVVTEERALYANGKIDRQNSGMDTNLVRYSLQFESGRWKIADYETIRTISR